MPTPLPVPGPRYGAIAQTFYYLARPERFLRECHRRYGDVFTIETVLFGREIVVVRPETIKTVFTGDSDQLRAGEANEVLEPVIGRKSVLRLDGAEHLRQRRLMMPPFHGERMIAYRHTMREITERIIATWPIGTPFGLHSHMQKLTLDVILRTIFGLEDGAEMDTLHEAIRRLMDFTSSPLGFLGTVPLTRKSFGGLTPWDRFTKLRKSVDDLIYGIIAHRRNAEKNKNKARTDVLSMLLEARDEQGAAMTDVELRDELMTLLAAGHETTATQLCWAVDKILHDKRVRDRLLEEIAQSDGEDANLPYLDATIKEVLRLAPVIPAVARRVKTNMTIAGFDVPAGSLLVPGIWVTHRLPDVYPDPEAFKPERFLDKKVDPYAWLPFGGGIRRCLGMAFALYELRVVLATILRSVRLRATTPSPARVVLRGFTHAPRGGPKVILEERLAPTERARRRKRNDDPKVDVTA